MTREDRINVVNIALIALSLLLAWFVPVHLFIIVYALLGPLHYLTEISWLHDHSYFIGCKRSPRALYCLAGVSALIPVVAVATNAGGEALRLWWQFSALAIFFAVVVSVIAVAGRQGAISARVAFTLLAAAALMLMFTGGTVFVASYMTTLVHVFVFTWIFMLAGALKSGRPLGFVALASFTLCAAAALLPVANGEVVSRELLFNLQQFGRMDLLTASIFGWRQPEQIVGIMRLIAFAYTYHYLNWFSKTQIICWHRISRVRALVIAAIYLSSIALYAFNYALGFKVLLFLSIVHVYLEFPLNIKTILGLKGQFAALRLRSQTGARAGSALLLSPSPSTALQAVQGELILTR